LDSIAGWQHSLFVVAFPTHEWELRSRNFVPHCSTRIDSALKILAQRAAGEGQTMGSIVITVLMLMVAAIVASMLVVMVDLLAEFDQG
jgi:hypothetical protein